MTVVLVLGAGGNVSQGILKALAASDLQHTAIAACVTPEAAGLHLADRAYVSPLADDPGFAPWLTRVCEQEGVTAVLSGSEPVLTALAAEADALRSATGAVCIVSPAPVLDVGRDKLATARWLEGNGFPRPRTASASDADALGSLLDDCGFPVIAKPRFGRGGERVREIHDTRSLACVEGKDDLVVQELLGTPEEEFTVGCFCDRDGDLRGSVAMRRALASGTTVLAEIGDHDEVRELAEKIAAKLGPAGPCNVQLRLDASGRPVPFEINVRFSGTTPLRARLGFNEVEEAIRHFALGAPARDLPRLAAATVVRYWNEVYLDGDDLEALRRDGVRRAPRGRVEDWGVARRPPPGE